VLLDVHLSRGLGKRCLKKLCDLGPMKDNAGVPGGLSICIALWLAL